MPDSDSPWPMHMVTRCHTRRLSSKGEVQIVEGAKVSGERWPAGYLSHELSGAIKARW